MKFLSGIFLCLFSSIIFASEYSIILLNEDNGTSIHLFQESHDAESIPTVKEIFTEQISAKLALFADHPESAPIALKKLFDHVAMQIQQRKVEHPVSVTIFNDGEIQFIPKEKMHAVETTLQKYIADHYPNTLSIKNFAIIPGKMKAFYGWLAVNYLKENLQNETPTVGSIFLNNYSLDIAYAVPKSEKSFDEITFTFHHKKYIVFAKSFLELGLSHIHEHLLVDEYAKFCFPKNADISAHIEGDFHAANCSEIFQGALKTANIHQKISGTFRVPQFVAFGDFYPTYHFFGVERNFDQESFEQDTLLPQCHNEWDTLKNAYPSEPNNALLYYCSNGIYFSDLFFEALDLRSEQIQVVSRINDENVHWVLGAALYKTL